MAQRIEDEEYSPLGEHVVEIPARSHAPSSPHRSYATLGAAAFITLLGVTIVIGVTQKNAARERDERAQREDLRQGWQALSTIAAEGAANDSATLAAASQPTAPPTVVVVPMQVSPPSTPITINQPLPASTLANSSPAPNTTNNAANLTANGMTTPVPVPVPIPVPDTFAPNALPLPANSTLTPPNASTPNPATATNLGTAPPSPSLVGTTPVPNGTTPIPNGTTPVPNPNQPAPVTPPSGFAVGQACGVLTCGVGNVCCNASCGICTPPGASCSQIQCG